MEEMRGRNMSRNSDMVRTTDTKSRGKMCLLCTVGVFLATGTVLIVDRYVSRRRLNSSPSDEIKMIFIRHGESVWNSKKGCKERFCAFSRGCCEICCCCEPIILDSILSVEGKDQCTKLRGLIQTADDANDAIKQLKTALKNDKTMVVTSNLRRPIATAQIAFDGEWRGKYLAHPYLQEMGSGADAMSKPCCTACLGCLPKKAEYLNDRPIQNGNGITYSKIEDIKDVSCCETKPGYMGFLCSVYGKFVKSIPCVDSFQSRFCQWAFTQDASQTMIVIGHGLWFKDFFEEFMPTDLLVPLPKLCVKIQETMIPNCECVSFTLERAGDTFKIRHDSVEATFEINEKGNGAYDFVPKSSTSVRRSESTSTDTSATFVDR